MPYYMAIGVSMDKFLDSCPKELEPYDKAATKKFELEDTIAYRQGMYVRDALVCTVGNMFKGKGQKAFEYPQKPYGISGEPTEEELQAQRKLFVESLLVMKKNFDMAHKNDRGGGD